MNTCTEERTVGESRDSANSRKRDFLVIPICLLILAGFIYANADHEEFLFDSRHGNIKTSDTKSALQTSLHDLLVTFWKPGEDLSRVTFQTNALINQAVGLAPYDVTGFLVGNVVVHAVNAWLVYLLILKLLRVSNQQGYCTPWIPLAAATWFTVHPLQANSVAYILQRRGSLSATFFVLAVLLYLSARSSGAKRYPKLIGVAFCYWLSIKSKFVGLPLPFAVLSIELCLRATDRQALRRYLTFLVPGLVLAVGGMFLFAWSRGLFSPATGVRAYSEGLDWTPWQHLLTESRVFLHYWKLLILPLPQWMCIDQRIEVSRTLMQHGAGLALAAHAGIIVAAVFAARRGWTLTAVGLFWFYVGLIPYAILPTHELFVEYKTYLPSIGCAFILAEGMQRLVRRFGAKPVLATAGLAILVLSIATVSRNRIYQSPIAFWSDAVRKYPDDERINLRMGYTYWTTGDTQKADEYYERAVRLAPQSGTVHHYYAGYLRKKGDHPKAVEQYLLALELPGEFPRQEAHYYAGQMLQGFGRVDESIPHLLKATEMAPEDASAHYALGNALVSKKDYANAIEHYKHALQITPKWPEALANLGNALLDSAQPAEAIRYYSLAIELKPDDPHTRLSLSYALSDLGRTADALSQVKESLRLDPKNPHAQSQLQTLQQKRGPS